jgi:hypothetical protein
MVESFETNFAGSSYSDLFDLFEFVIKLINIPNFYLLCVKSIQKSENHQPRIFLDNYYRQRCLV